MTNGKVILAMVLVVAGSLVAATVVGAFAGGIAGYLVARWEGGGPSPAPLPEEREEIPFPLPFKGEKPVVGALVTQVEPDSPAAEAGIKVGDIITAVNGVEIDEDHPLRDLVLEHEPGEKITLTLSHWGEEREVQATLGETKDEEGKPIPYLGVHYLSMEQRYFPPQRFDLGRLPQPKLNLRDLLRRIRPRLPNV